MFDPARRNPYVGTLSVKIVLDQRVVGILDSADLIECYFIEDIFSFCMTGKLTFYDKYGIFEKGPLTGHEMISLVYGVDEEREIRFHIWKVKNITQVSNVNPTAENITELHIVDSSFYSMMLPKFSISFAENTACSDIVKHLLKKMIGWEDTKINMENSSTIAENGWVMPYWNVTTSIKYLMSHAKGVSSGTGGYLCYNNTYNTFSVSFYTMNWLFGENNTLDAKDYVFEGENPDTQNKILEWWIEGPDKSTMSSVFGGKWRGVDTSKKELIQNDYTFNDGIKDTVLLGSKSTFPDASDLNCTQKLSGEGSSETLFNSTYNEWVKVYSLQNKINIIIQGNEKRYAGMQITIQWPSINKTFPQNYNKQMEGKYLVRSITHNFVGKGTSNINYMQRVVLIKNGFERSDSQYLVQATKMNISGGKKKEFVRMG